MSLIQRVIHLILTFLEACIHVLSKERKSKIHSKSYNNDVSDTDNNKQKEDINND